MAQIAARITGLPSTQSGEVDSIRFRARNDAGAGPETDPIPFRTVLETEARQVRNAGRWVDVSDFGLANALVQVLARSSQTEGRAISQAAEIVSLSSEIGTKAAATALDALRTEVEQDIEGNITALSEQLTALEVSLAAYATVMALNALTVRVTETETDLLSTAAEITALEAAHGGRTLGPEQNLFTGADETEAATARDNYATANPSWLADYDADNDLNIELRWGVLYRYWRRLNGAWVANGEALARAAAVTTLNATVGQQGSDIVSLSGLVTQLSAAVGDFTASAYQELVVRVDQVEDVDGNTTLAGLARWLVKTQIGDLVAGVGLYNDGTSTRFLVNADTFAVLPPGATTDANARIPFIVRNGRVYIDSAVIDDATIDTAHIRQAAITRALIADLAVNAAKIENLNAFDIMLNSQLRTDNYVDGVSGVLIDRDGAAQFPGANVLGEVSAAAVSTRALNADRADITDLATRSLTANTADIANAFIGNLDASRITTGLLDAMRIRLNGTLLSATAAGLTVNPGTSLGNIGGGLGVLTGGVGTTQIGSRAATDFGTAVSVTGNLGSGAATILSASVAVVPGTKIVAYFSANTTAITGGNGTYTVQIHENGSSVIGISGGQGGAAALTTTRTYGFTGTVTISVVARVFGGGTGGYQFATLQVYVGKR